MSKKIIVILGVLLIAGESLSQDQRVLDSLKHTLTQAKNDSSRVIAYELIARAFRKVNKDSAYYYNQQAVNAAKKGKDPAFLAEAYREYGLNAQAHDDYKQAKKYYQLALEVHHKAGNKKGVGDAHNDIGIAYYYDSDFKNAEKNFRQSGGIKLEIGDSIGAGQAFNNTGIMLDIAGNPTEALQSYLKALNIYENARDTSLIIGTMSNIGLIYIGQKNYREALKIYTRQKNLAELIGNKRLYGVALASEGTCYDYMEDYARARKCFLEALDIHKELGDQPSIAQCYTNLSVNYELSGEDDEALEYALKALKIKKEIGSIGKLAITQIAAAKVYDKKGQFQKALSMYQDALENAETTGYFDYVIKAHQGLSKVYSRIKDFERAYHHQSLYVSYSDSITNTKNAEMITQMEKKFQNERKQQEIELLNKTSALKDIKLEKAGEENKRKSLQLYGSLLVVLILLILAGIIFKSSQQRKKNNLLLQQKNTEITRQKEIVEEQHKEITDSISYAKRIQEAILPSRYSLTENLKNGFVLFKPKDVVSGDFYWLENHQEAIYFAAADCTGHGVPGAMVSVICSNALSKSLLEENIANPGKILDRTRELVVERFAKSDADVKDGMDISLVALQQITNTKTKNNPNLPSYAVQWAGANNPLWIVRKGATEVEEIKPDKQPIGKTDNPLPFTTHTLELEPGDTLYIFTDGYQDQFGGERGKKFKAGKLRELLLRLQPESMEKQKELIHQAFNNWKGDLEQVDDVCIIGVRL